MSFINGWRIVLNRFNRKLALYFLTGCLVSCASAPVQPPLEDEELLLELLEYLLEFETEDGEWIDPHQVSAETLN